jgi:hypothetical protein
MPTQLQRDLSSFYSETELETEDEADRLIGQNQLVSSLIPYSSHMHIQITNRQQEAEQQKQNKLKVCLLTLATDISQVCIQRKAEADNSVASTLKHRKIEKKKSHNSVFCPESCCHVLSSTSSTFNIEMKNVFVKF